MYLASTIKLCGDHFTRDLAHALCVSFDDTEVLKLEFGGAIHENCPENVMVELPVRDGRDRQAPRRFIAEVLGARAAQLFQYVRGEIARVGMDRSLAGGVFLTGGGARLPDLCDVAEAELQCQVRFGLPIGIEDWPEDMDDPEWSAAAGLAMYSAKLKAQTQQQQAAAGWLGKILR
jgi:cell division protein FtsA